MNNILTLVRYFSGDLCFGLFLVVMKIEFAKDRHAVFPSSWMPPSRNVTGIQRNCSIGKMLNLFIFKISF